MDDTTYLTNYVWGLQALYILDIPKGDTLGLAILSFVGRLSSSWKLKMYWKVVLFSEVKKVRSIVSR